MEYTKLGRTGMHVSRLCLGTMNFGMFTEEKEAFRIMDRAREAGINFFDTADAYGKGRAPGGAGYHGWTEDIIGRWFAQGNGRRESTIMATKVYCDMDDPYEGPNDQLGLSAYKVRRHLEGSLKRLQTDHVELYQMHHVDRSITWEETWGVFENIVEQGKAVYIGSANFAGWNLMDAQAAAAKRNFLGLVSEQHTYNLVCRLPELELLPAAKHLGMGVIVWGPLGGAMLSGKVLNPAPGSRGEKLAAALTPARRKQLEDYAALCKELGASEATVALAWLLHNPAITAPIIGPRTIEQLEDSLKAVELKLDADVLKKLDEIFPGPGKGAPEAYAW